MVAIVIRVVAIGVLLLGPWTDEATELSGWDAERFQEIADRDAAAWVDQPIEYPPGSVALFDLIAGDDVVSTNRAIIVVSAIAEVAGTALLWRRFGARAAKGFTILGLPLVPMGYLRLDLVVTIIAAAAAVALVSGPHKSGRTGRLGQAAFAALVVIGAMIKLWPALLIMGAVGIGRRSAALFTAALGALAGLIWLGVVGDGLEPLDQVLSLRGATGWHLESLPGALIALVDDGEPRLELNAFRIGTISDPLVLVGRALAVLMTIALAVAAAAHSGERGLPVRRLGLVMLGSVAALMITAPLVSPQFVLWLTPWGALLLVDRGDGGPEDDEPALDRPLWLLAAAVVLTGFTLTAFGPANLAQTVPALLLTVRNLALLAIAPACLIALRSMPGAALDREPGPRVTADPGRAQ